MRVEINNYNFFLIMPENVLSQVLRAEKKIMPEKKLDLDVSDAIELRNFQMWVKREMTIFKRNPALQQAVAGNIDKATSFPIELLIEAMRK